MDLDAGRLIALNVIVEDHDTDRLIDQDVVEEFMTNLCDDISMEPLRQVVFDSVGADAELVGLPDADDGGLTAILPISTSHLAYHSWPLQNRFRLVVDSCRDFDIEDVLACVHAYWDVERYRHQDMPYEAPL